VTAEGWFVVVVVVVCIVAGGSGVAITTKSFMCV
jgi:hypothetical protein